MKKNMELKFPKSLQKIVDQDGIWETEAFDPIFVSVIKVEHIGREVLGYQIEFEVFDQEFEPINARMAAKGIEANGEEWEALLRRYIREQDVELSQRLHGDSDSHTCVVWVETEADIHRLLALVTGLLANPDAAESNLLV